MDEDQPLCIKSLGIFKNAIAKYCEGAEVPWIRKTPERVSTDLAEEVIAFIQSCLDEDEAESLKKQWQTARRI